MAAADVVVPSVSLQENENGEVKLKFYVDWI